METAEETLAKYPHQEQRYGSTMVAKEYALQSMKTFAEQAIDRMVKLQLESFDKYVNKGKGSPKGLNEIAEQIKKELL